jgi:hypothetical protein
VLQITLQKRLSNLLELLVKKAAVATVAFFYLGKMFMMNLHEVNEETIDYILSLPELERLTYYSSLINKFYPNITKNTLCFERLLKAYETSFVVEKLYRNNKFFKEGFTNVYTKTGLLRNIISDLYFADDDLITH